LLYKGESPNAPTFHNIYLNPETYSYFRDNGKFPDPTMLVMDIYENRGPGGSGHCHARELER